MFCQKTEALMFIFDCWEGNNYCVHRACGGDFRLSVSTLLNAYLRPRIFMIVKHVSIANIDTSKDICVYIHTIIYI